MENYTETKGKSGIKTKLPVDFRNGICIGCQTKMVVQKVKLSSVARFVPPLGATFKCNICGEVHDSDSEIGIAHWKEWRDRLVDRPVCPKCSGMIGHLIARTTPIPAPEAPKCIKPKCIFKFIKRSIFLTYLAEYHGRRVAYAQANRPEKGHKILDRYRTGEPSPKNTFQCIMAIQKLKNPLLRNI